MSSARTTSRSVASTWSYATQLSFDYYKREIHHNFALKKTCTAKVMLAYPSWYVALLVAFGLEIGIITNYYNYHHTTAQCTVCVPQ